MVGEKYSPLCAGDCLFSGVCEKTNCTCSPL